MTRRAALVRADFDRADWAPGDFALRITSEHWRDDRTGRVQPGPARGQIIEVAEVIVCGWPCGRHTFLGFAQFQPRCYWHQHFRKVSPIVPEEEDQEVIRQMRGAKVPHPV